MSLWESIKVAISGLSANKMRSFLTTLGIIIGVAAVIVMVSIGQGANKQVEDRISTLGSNLLIVMGGRTSTSSRTGGSAGIRGSSNVLTFDHAKAIMQGTNTVEKVAPELSQYATVKFGAANTTTNIVGTTPDYPAVRNFEIAEGRFFDESDDASAKRVAVIGQTVVEDIFGGANPVGQEIKINNRSFQVIGVLAKKGQSTTMDNDDRIFIPLKTAERRLFGTAYLRYIYVQVRSNDQMDLAMQEVSNILLHELGDPEKFYVRNQEEILNAASETNRTFTLLLAGVASVALIVGGIGIMNIMLVSVTERTREIGIRKALGALRRDILIQFLIESIVLSLIGGLLGILFGVGGSVLVARLAGWVTLLSTQAIVLAFSFSALVGVFFGIYPANKASALDPIEALRYE